MQKSLYQSWTLSGFSLACVREEIARRKTRCPNSEPARLTSSAGLCVRPGGALSGAPCVQSGIAADSLFR